MFDDKDVILLKVVRCLKKTKMSISEIKKLEDTIDLLDLKMKILNSDSQS